MISKLKENAQFILTKAHTILYYEHTYSLNKYSEINFNIPKNDFINAFKKSKNLRIIIQSNETKTYSLFYIMTEKMRYN